MSGIVIGGPTAWRVRQRGPLGIAYHWINNEPSLVIYPLVRGMKLVGAMPYVLPLSAGHEIVSQGDQVDVGALVEKATKAAEVIGYGGDKFMARLIADVILDGIDELYDMPNEPPELEKRPAPTGVASFKVDGETVAEREL